VLRYISSSSLGTVRDHLNVLIKQANGVFQWVHIIMPTIQQKILRRQSPKDHELGEEICP
jgi:hypothetical protein